MNQGEISDPELSFVHKHYKKHAAAFKTWRQRLSYFSVLSALPVVMGWQVPEVRADELTAPTEPAPAADQAGNPGINPANRYTRPTVIKRQRGIMQPYPEFKFDLLSSPTAGADNCPGAAVPIGPYSVAAPFTDSGDTTGANNTFSNLYYYYYWIGVPGPDHIYSFTLTGRGPAAEIRVTPTSATYDPAIYVLDSRGGCPSGTGNIGWWFWVYSNATGGGTPEVLDSNLVNSLPLNVPLYLAVDSGNADQSGPYTLRMQDVTIASGPRTKFDFDGDAYSDISVHRTSDNVWYRSLGGNSFAATPFGAAGDRIVPADYDGDGKTDIAVYRDGTWWWIDSSGPSVRVFPFGMASDTPVPADFTGDGRAELAVYRDGVWWTYNLANGQISVAQFGTATDKPVVGDFDADGRADRAVYRNGIWFLDRSTQGFAAIQWGLPTDKVVPADYDGDGRTDPAIYRDGDWWIFGSRQGVIVRRFGSASGVPAAADYDADGKVDMAYYSNGEWHIRGISWGGEWVTAFGLPTDTPIASTYNR